MKPGITITVTIEKLVFGGQALAHYENKPIFIWNALPGEVVEVEVTKRTSKYWEGIATTVIEPAPYRIQPQEAHFLSSSPWDIMPLEQEHAYKSQIAWEVFTPLHQVLPVTQFEVVSNDQAYQYRNKIEFSFYEYDPPRQGVSLAFFQRGKRYKMPIESSVLAEPIINTVAHDILGWINQHQLNRTQLKSLIIRSNGQGEAIAALFLKESLQFEDFPKLNAHCKGLQIYYSTPKSPASVVTDILYSIGQDYLTVNILDVQLQFGLLSFFQVNIPVFKQALQDITSYISSGDTVVDYYSGVGAIGLTLFKKAKQIQLIESHPEAVQYAQQNIANNKIKNATAYLSTAEDMTNFISSDATVIVDPPRAGLHAHVIAALLKNLPPRIIYLSCNLSTQVRDIHLLLEQYTISTSKLYNFFPRTPHIESLCVLELKS